MSTPPSTDDLVSFRTVAHWARAAALCDIDLGALLRLEGVEGLLSHPAQAEIERAKLESLMRRCVEATWSRRTGKHFPIVLADTFAFDYMPDIGLFVSSAPTLRDAAKVLDLAPAFFDPALNIGLSEMGDQARLLIRYTQVGERVEVSAPFIEAAFALCVKVSRTLLGHAQATSRIGFRHRQHEGHEACAACFQVPVEYGQPVDALWFDRVALDRRLRGAMELAHTSSRSRLQDQVDELHRAGLHETSSGLAASLITRLINRPELVQLDLRRAADHLALHPRTLQRRLKAEGSSYSEVLDQARFQLTQQWLAATPNLTAEELSQRLGFADRTGFAKAFERWTSMTLAEFRSG